LRFCFPVTIGGEISLEAPTLEGGFSDSLDKTLDTASVADVPLSKEVPMPANKSATLESYRERIKWVDSYPSWWNVDKTQLTHTYYSKPKMTIANFSNILDFKIKVDELAEKLIDIYDGLRMNVPKIIEPSLSEGKVTLPSKGGFDITQFNGSERSSIIRDVTQKIRSMIVDKLDNTRNTKETAYYVGSQWENELIDFSHALWERDMYSVEDVYYPIRQILSTTEYAVAPLPIEMSTLPQFHVILWEPSYYDLLVEFLDNNIIFQKAWVDLVSADIMKSLEVFADPVSVTMSELRKTLQVSTNIQSGLHDITSVLSADKAFQMLHMIVMGTLFQRYFALEVDLAPSTFSWTAVLDSVFMILVIPEKLLTIQSRNRIRNYVYKHYISTLQSAYHKTKDGKFIRNYPEVDDNLFDTHDYLGAALNAGLLPNYMVPFFSNWANGPSLTPRS